MWFIIYFFHFNVFFIFIFFASLWTYLSCRSNWASLLKILSQIKQIYSCFFFFLIIRFVNCSLALLFLAGVLLLTIGVDLLGSEQSQSDDKIGSNVDLSGVGEVGREGKMVGSVSLFNPKLGVVLLKLFCVGL